MSHAKQRIGRMRAGAGARAPWCVMMHMMQQPSPCQAPHLPKSQVPSPGSPGSPKAVDAVCPLVRCPSGVTTLLCPPTRALLVGCRLCSTLLLTDPAAAKFLALIGGRFLLRLLNFC